MPLAATYAWPTVGLSYLIATIASYAALDLAGRITEAHGRGRAVWLAAGAFAMGIGIWSMHFTGMQAFALAGTPVVYHVPLTLASIVPAIAASALALHLASRPALGARHLLAGALVMGAGIVAMHYLGMAAMRMQALVTYDPALVAASFGVAVAASLGALALAFALRGESFAVWSWRKLGGALVMGAAISGMHYTGMAAATFVPAVCPAPRFAVGVSSLGGGAIAFTTLFVLMVAMIAAYKEHLQLQQRALEVEKGHTGRTKHEFLSVLSHELRTPINALMGYGSILEDGLAGPLNPRQQEFVRRMLRSADGLLALVNDMLDMGNIQAGRFAVAPHEMDLGALARDVVAEHEPLAIGRGQAIALELAPGLPPLLADAERVRKVLSHLVANAVKFGPEGQVVRVRARHDAGLLRVEVDDEGPGVPPEALPRLFALFTQGDMSATREAGGTGLGLPLAKALVEAHGGNIGAEPLPGRGTRFWFTLPVAGPPAGGMRRP